MMRMQSCGGTRWQVRDAVQELGYGDVESIAEGAHIAGVRTVHQARDDGVDNEGAHGVALLRRDGVQHGHDIDRAGLDSVLGDVDRPRRFGGGEVPRVLHEGGLRVEEDGDAAGDERVEDGAARGAVAHGLQAEVRREERLVHELRALAPVLLAFHDPA